MSIANEKQPLPRARMRRNGAVRLMDAAALAVLAGWLVLALGVWYPQYAADTAAAASPYLAALQERTAMSFEELWHLTLLVMQGGGALFMFLGAALWRLHVRRHALPYGRQARRAVHTCRACGHPAGAGRLGLCGMACGAARADGRICVDVCLRAGGVSAELSSERISAVFRRTGSVRGPSGRVSPGVRREVQRS